MTASTTQQLTLPFRPPLRPDNLFGHLVATAVPGVEEWRDGWYRRTLRLPHGPGVVGLRPAGSVVECSLTLADSRDTALAVSRCRWLLDLDADPDVVDSALGRDPLLAPLVLAAPGRRVPRTVDAAEFAVRAVLGQQVSTAAARTHAGRLVRAFGTPVADSSLTHLFPLPAEIDPSSLAMPASRKRTMAALLAAFAEGLSLDGPAARSWLASLPGFGPWTVEVIAMRALGDPDAFIATDLGVRKAALSLGLPATPAALVSRAEAWRPWRAYAVQHLWARV